MRAAVYARSESHDPLLAASEIARQFLDAMRLCAVKDLQLADVYYDCGFTGAMLDRPKLQEMLQDAKANKFQFVVVREQQDLCSYWPNLMILSLKLRKSGVHLQEAA